VKSKALWKKLGILSLAAATVFSVTNPVSAQVIEEPVRKSSEYNLDEGVGLKGFDPVAVFPEGGGAPKKGVEEFRLEYMGVIYFFASAQNLDLFVTNPDKYEPTYGGWCAFAMASGSYVDIQPHLFTINGNRAHYFVAQRAKANFDRNLSTLEPRADDNWFKFTGESPRL
jgi:YHS domain-containing protein